MTKHKIKQMKYLYTAFVAALMVVMLNGLNNSAESKANGSPGKRTGSPGDNGSTCTGCHSGTAAALSGIISTNIPTTGYKKDSVYTITVTAVGGTTTCGFELTAESTTGAKVGTWTLTNTTQTKLTNANAAVTHKVTSATTWSANWTAPATSTGDIKFYTAMIFGNGNGSDTGDNTKTSNITVTPNTGSTTAVESPSAIAGVSTRLFPNPCQGQFELTYNTASAGQVTVIAYDMTGKKAIQLLSENQSTGIHKQNFSTENHLSPGLYLISINTPEGQVVRKLMVQ